MLEETLDWQTIQRWCPTDAGPAIPRASSSLAVVMQPSTMPRIPGSSDVLVPTGPYHRSFKKWTPPPIRRPIDSVRPIGPIGPIPSTGAPKAHLLERSRSCVGAESRLGREEGAGIPELLPGTRRMQELGSETSNIKQPLCPSMGETWCKSRGLNIYLVTDSITRW